jgi:Tfp pilus assembly protein PilF
MADRYTYLPLIGVFLMLVWAAGDWVGNLRPRRRLMAAIASILLLVCAVQTNSQVRYWHDTETIFTHALTVTRNNWVAHENLAVFASQKYQETQRSSIEGQLLASSGSESDAATSRKVRHDYLDDMLRHAQAALEIRPGLAPAHVSMAKALIERGQLDAARAHLEAAIRLEPSNAYAHQDLAEILSRQGQVKDAIVEYQNALKLKPDWEPVMNNLAWFLATNQDPAIRNGAEAVRLAERACALTVGTNLWYCHTLAAAYAENNEFTKSIATAEQARQLALASGRKELVQTAENRLALYRAGHCYREP